jgi:hypothetical protein
MRTARLVLAAEIRERDIHADVHVWLFPVFVRSMCDAATVVYRERLNDER